MKQRSLNLSSTLFALATGRPPTAVAMVRVSGSRAFEIAERVCRDTVPKERGMQLKNFFSEDGKLLDQGLVLTFVGPQSFTGEDVIEFQCHGSVAVVEALEQTLLGLGAQPAQGGEFSYRAFLNGKLNGQDVERLADVYRAVDNTDLQSIYMRFDQATEVLVSDLREIAVRLQAIVDTAIDFSDEYSRVIESARPVLDKLLDGCSRLLNRYSAFQLEKAPARIVLAGAPNAGKSALFNALLRRHRSIVRPEAGTTRDVVEEDFFLGRSRVKLVDTAGQRVAAQDVEAEGIELAQRYLKNATVWVLVVDATRGLSDADRRLLDTYGQTPHLVAWNKVDLPEAQTPPQGFVSVSALSALGLDGLERLLAERVLSGEQTVDSFLPSASQAKRLEEVVARIETMRTLFDSGLAPECLSEENRHILSLLDGFVGFVDTEMVLDRVFSDFCIGK